MHLIPYTRVRAHIRTHTRALYPYRELLKKLSQNFNNGFDCGIKYLLQFYNVSGTHPTTQLFPRYPTLTM